MYFKKKEAFYILFLLISNCVFSQYKILGSISDKETKLPIVGVSVIILDSKSNFISNEEGQFEFQIKEFPITLKISCIGFETEHITLINNDLLNIYLKPSIIQLKEIFAGNPAVGILNNVIRKELLDTNTTYDFKAYYQRVSSNSGEINKFHEMYLNFRWKSLGVDKWKPLNVRVFQSEHQTSLPKNLTFLSFFHSSILHKQDNFPINFSDLEKNYIFKIEKYIDVGTDAEIAIINCRPKKGEYNHVIYEGNIFVNTKFDNVLRIKGTYIFPTVNKFNRILKVEVNFTINKENKSVFNNIFSTMEVWRGPIKNKNIDKQWLNVIEGIDIKDIDTYYPNYMKNDIELLKSFNNSQEFWSNNIPIKPTKEISNFIRKTETNEKEN